MKVQYLDSFVILCRKYVVGLYTGSTSDEI